MSLRSPASALAHRPRTSPEAVAGGGEPAPPSTVASTAVARLVLSGAGLATACAGLAGWLAGAHDLRVAGVLGYLLVGVGSAPWARHRGMRPSTRLALTVLTGMCTLVLGSTAMLRLGLWHPGVAAAVLVAVTVPVHVVAVRGAVRELPGRPALRLSPSPAMAAAGFLLCLSAALTHRHIVPGLWGFLTQIGPFWYAGLALLVAAVATARPGPDRGLALAAMLLILTLTGTPALVYDGPRSQSASKHLEFVEQIRAVYQINSTISLYRDWPGYFSAVAWVCDAAGVRAVLPVATAWPVVIGVARVAAMHFLASRVLRSPAQVWTAVVLGFLADPIGADYFSPQSLGFVLGLLAFGVALSSFPIGPKAALLLALGAGLAVSHQLSPYVVGGVLVVLAAFRQIRPWWLPLTVLGPAAGWALLHWPAVQGFVSLGSMGDARNFRPPQTDAAPGLARHPIVTLTVLALVLGILLLGAVAAGALLRDRRSRPAWAMASCPAVGLVIVAMNPYGYEGIFRAALFGIPWLALLAARLTGPAPAWWPRGGRLVLTAALCGTYLIAAFGLDGSNVLRPADRTAFLHYRAQPTPPGRIARLLLIGPGDLPSSPPTQGRRHLSVKRADLDLVAPGEPGEPARRTVDRMTRGMIRLDGGNPLDAPLYAIWSPASAFYAREYGLETPQRFAALREAFRSDPRWTVAFESSGTVLFRYRGPLRAGQPG